MCGLLSAPARVRADHLLVYLAARPAARGPGPCENRVAPSVTLARSCLRRSFACRITRLLYAPSARDVKASHHRPRGSYPGPYPVEGRMRPGRQAGGPAGPGGGSPPRCRRRFWKPSSGEGVARHAFLWRSPTIPGSPGRRGRSSPTGTTNCSSAPRAGGRSP